MENTTIVTALYNIQREYNGDGRKWCDYLEWFKSTLELPLPMIIYVGQEDLIEYIHLYRDSNVSTKIIFQPLHEIPYAYYEKTFATILNESSYQSKIRDPKRVECKLPFYNIIQYSKFKWLENAANQNPFKSDYFLWMDAGISRFIPFNLYHKIKPRLQLPTGKLVIQHNHLLKNYPINEQYLWDSQCLMCGTMFGGDFETIIRFATAIDNQLKERVPKGWINNEQLLLAYIYDKHPDWFGLVFNDTQNHLCLFEKIFI